MIHPSASLRAAFLACLLTFGLLLGRGPAQAAPLVRLPGHLSPNALRRAVPLGRARAEETVPLVLALSPRDPAGLDALLRRIYSPGDPLFHHFLVPAEFAHRFSPTPQTYEAVAEFAEANGLIVTGTHPDRLLLEVSGPASAVEAAFRVHLQNYAAPDGRVFHAPDSNPAVPAALAGKITGVIGLQNSLVLRPHLRRRSYPFLPSNLFLLSASDQPDGIGTDPHLGGLTPSDIKAAYNLSSTPLTGQGRTLALYELDGYDPADIAAYEKAYGLPQVPLQNISVDGASGVPGGDAGEVTLDIELMVALAPGATAIRVYEATNGTSGLVDAYAQIADDNIAKEVSTSWGDSENVLTDATRNAENTIFKQMAAQGQSLYAASGDSGAYDDGADLSVDDPASQPFVTGVGGTTLSVVARGGAFRSETAWGDPSNIRRSPDGAGGGGGISTVWPIPDYQGGVPGLGSKTQRNVPDVSLDADPNTGYSIYFGGSWTVFGGTSCAAPLWAAFTALVNEQRQANKQPDLGFANPQIYRIAGGADYHSGFHDVADGSTNLYYQATPGYDNATGWGSFNGANLLALFAPQVVVNANPISALTVTPSSVVGGLTAKGTVTLTNPAPAGGASVTVSVSTGPAGVPPTVLVAAGDSSVDFPISTTAVTAPATVTLTAAYSGSSRSAPLTVLPPPVLITPVSVSLNPASVGGGASSVATVVLSGPAPDAGLTISLASSDPAATVPASVVVLPGAVSVQFTVATVPVTAQVAATLSASLNGVTQTATLTLKAPELEPIALSPVSVTGGNSASAILTLTYPAPAGGAVITLTSSDPSVAVPASVTIPVGQTTLPVTLTTSVVPVATAVTITATYTDAPLKAVLTVNAVLPLGLTVAPASVIGGAAATGTLTLGAPAPAAGLSASLAADNAAVLLPATLAIPPGAVSVPFAIPTANVSAPVSATITVTLNGVAQTAPLTILPIQITTLNIAPTSVVIGTSATGRLTLNAPAPAGGLAVALSSSAAAATVPVSVLVPAGASSVTFTIGAARAGSGVISATLAGATQTATLVVVGAPGTSYPAGLNLLSAPYDYPGVPLDGLFGYAGVRLAVEQPTTGAYTYTPNAPADALRLGRGYWVNLPSAVTLSSVGTPADTTHDFAIALQPGWNQIGDPFTTTIKLGNVGVSAGAAAVPFDQAASASPLLVSSLVYRYAPGQGKVAGSYVWVRATDSLQPGLGYWVYAYQSVTLVIPHP